jgi:lipopolysaccharide transport system permease protein
MTLSGHQLSQLPEAPLIVIAPSRPWAPLQLRELWMFRELLYFLACRDVKVRYKQTVLGAAWAVLQPLLTMLLFALLFGRVAGIKSDGLPYPIFSYAGLLIWTFFANSVTNSGNSLVGGASLITKIYFPRMIVPAASVGAGLIDLGLAFLIQIVLLIHYRVAITPKILMVPALVMLATLLSLGVGLWFSALNVSYRDIRHALPFVVQLWMFASPVIYPFSMVQGKLRWILILNPLTGIIESFRVALFGIGGFDWTTLGTSIALTLCILVCSAYSFRKRERQFADVI